MEYQIIGKAVSSFRSKKNNKEYLPICVLSKDLTWTGLKAEQILLSEDVLKGLSVDTDNGEIFANDNRKYFIDIQYNNRGFIIDAKVYNK